MRNDLCMMTVARTYFQISELLRILLHINCVVDRLNVFVRGHQTQYHCQCAIDLVDFTCFAHCRFDDVTVFVVTLSKVTIKRLDEGFKMTKRGISYAQIMLENVSGRFHRNDIVHNEFTVAGQIVAFLVQFFDTRLILTVCECERKLPFEEICEEFTE